MSNLSSDNMADANDEISDIVTDPNTKIQSVPDTIYASLDSSALESYASEYSGRTAIMRLHFLASKIPSASSSSKVQSSTSRTYQPKHLARIKREAFLRVIPLIKKETLDHELYEQVIIDLQEMSQTEMGAKTESRPENGRGTEKIANEGRTARSAQAVVGVDRTTDQNTRNAAPEPMDIDNRSAETSQGRREDSGENDNNGLENMIEAKGGVDEEWLNETILKSKRELEKLEIEMKTYATNMIKESIRLTHHSLAKLLVQTGDFEGAIKNYIKARDYNSTPSHELDASMGIIEISLLAQQYNQTLPSIVKADYALNRMIAKQQEASNSASAAGLNRQELGEGLILLTETGERGMARTVETGAQSRERQRKAKELGEMGARTAFKLRAAKGLAHMGSGQYEAAAREFINMDGKLEDWEGKVLSSSDLTIYAILTSTASLSRESLKSNILGNSTMRHLIDYGNALYMSDMLRAFIDAKYDKVFSILQEHAWRHDLDPHLRAHIRPLTSEIRKRAIVQYLSPYQSVHIPRMVVAFGYGQDKQSQLTDEVIGLITSKRLNVKVDMIDKILHAPAPDHRKALFDDVLRKGEEIKATSTKAMLHMQMVQAGIAVENKAPKVKGSQEK